MPHWPCWRQQQAERLHGSLKTSLSATSLASTHLLGRGAIPAALALDGAQRLANVDPRITDDAALADHAGHLLVARDGGRAGKAAHLSLRLDAHGGRDAAHGAADAAERRCA